MSKLSLHHVCCLIIAFGSCLGASCTSVETTFSQGTEGWIPIGDAEVGIDPTDGKPAPALMVRDGAGGERMGIASTRGFKGDLREYNEGRFSMDLRLVSDPYAGSKPLDGGFGTVTIVANDGLKASFNFVIDELSTRWKTYDVLMLPEYWGMSPLYWAELLGDVGLIAIDLEYRTNPSGGTAEVIGIDNIKLESKGLWP